MLHPLTIHSLAKTDGRDTSLDTALNKLNIKIRDWLSVDATKTLEDINRRFFSGQAAQQDAFIQLTTHFKGRSKLVIYQTMPIYTESIQDYYDSDCHGFIKELNLLLPEVIEAHHSVSKPDIDSIIYETVWSRITGYSAFFESLVPREHYDDMYAMLEKAAHLESQYQDTTMESLPPPNKLDESQFPD